MDHGVGGVRRDAQVVESTGFASQFRLGVLEGLGQTDGSGRSGDVGDATAELVPVLVGDHPPGELVAGGAGHGLVLEVVEVLQRGGHDPTFREQAGPREVEETGQELASGQIAGGPEQDDHVGRHGRVVLGDR